MDKSTTIIIAQIENKIKKLEKILLKLISSNQQMHIVLCALYKELLKKNKIIKTLGGDLLCQEKQKQS